MTLPHGWFEIPGVQTGVRDVAERVAPLGVVLKFAKGASVLDLGCAEGLIGQWLIDQGGATSLLGLDKHKQYLDTARRLMKRYPNVEFQQCDFDLWDHRDRCRIKLAPPYDITLCLNVAQKLLYPEKFLRSVAAMTTKVFVYSGPHEKINDFRSWNEEVDVIALFESEGYTLAFHDPGTVDEIRGHLGVRLVFVRNELWKSIKKRNA